MADYAEQVAATLNDNLSDIREARRWLEAETGIVWTLGPDPARLMDSSWGSKPAKMMPAHITVGLRLDARDGITHRSVTVSGNLLNKDGSVGERRAFLDFRSLDEMPAWLVEIVQSYFTAELHAEVQSRPLPR